MILCNRLTFAIRSPFLIGTRKSRQKPLLPMIPFFWRLLMSIFCCQLAVGVFSQRFFIPRHKKFCLPNVLISFPTSFRKIEGENKAMDSKNKTEHYTQYGFCPLGPSNLRQTVFLLRWGNPFCHFVRKTSAKKLKPNFIWSLDSLDSVLKWKYNSITEHLFILKTPNSK